MRALTPCRLAANACTTGRSDDVVPPLGLHVDHVKVKLVVPNHAVDATIAGLTDNGRSVLKSSAMSHSDYDIKNEFLEEARRYFRDTRQQFVRKRFVYLRYGAGYCLLSQREVLVM